MRIRLGVPRDANRDEKEAILNAALEAATRGAETQMVMGRAPTAVDAIKRGVRWKPEPPGDEHFDLPRTVLNRGWGDCDDLAPWHAASLRITGEDPEASAIVRPSAPNRWHALVQRSDGSIEDPSLWAGMHSIDGDGPWGYPGATWPSMFGQRLAMATYPDWPGHLARVDVPSTSVPAVYSLVHKGRSPASAVAGACRGAPIVCGHDAYDDDLARVAGMHDLVIGIDPQVVDAALEQDGYVGFLPALAPMAASVAAPMASKLLSSFGGGGGKGGGAPAPGAGPPPGAAMSCPGGPIIVRF